MSIRGEFLFSIEELGKHPKLKSHHPVGPDDRLAQHLSAYYWRGKIDIESDLIVTFYNKASDEIAARAMEALGRGLGKVASIEEDTKNRLKDLWIKRFENAKQDPSSHHKELREFGTWFISKQYEDSWSLTQLKEVLIITGDIESDHQAFERLAELSSHYPEEVIDCVRLMIEGNKREWAVMYWRDEIREILKNVLGTENDAKEKAVDLINRLISLGNLDFKELLPKE